MLAFFLKSEFSALRKKWSFKENCYLFFSDLPAPVLFNNKWWDFDHVFCIGYLAVIPFCYISHISPLPPLPLCKLVYMSVIE